MKEIVFMEKEEVEGLYKEMATLRLRLNDLTLRMDRDDSPHSISERMANLEKSENLQRSVNSSVVENFKRHDKVLEVADKRLESAENRLANHHDAFARLGQRVTAFEGDNLDVKIRESLKRIMRV